MWREAGGPAVGVPENTGFGTKLLTKILSAELGNLPISLRFEATGLVAEIRQPAANLVED
jgi:hypothetical protein